MKRKDRRRWNTRYTRCDPISSSYIPGVPIYRRIVYIRIRNKRSLRAWIPPIYRRKKDLNAKWVLNVEYPCVKKEGEKGNCIEWRIRNREHVQPGITRVISRLKWDNICSCFFNANNIKSSSNSKQSPTIIYNNYSKYNNC